jgi:hypothetical protein
MKLTIQNAVVDFLDTEFLAGQDRRDGNKGISRLPKFSSDCDDGDVGDFTFRDKHFKREKGSRPARW